MARSLVFRFREWLADKFGLQYPVQRQRKRRKWTDADKAKMRDALRDLAIGLSVLIVLMQRREGRALLLAFLLLLGVLLSTPVAFIL